MPAPHADAYAGGIGVKNHNATEGRRVTEGPQTHGWSLCAGRHAVRAEPSEAFLPAIPGIRLAVAGPVVGVERVPGLRVHDDGGSRGGRVWRSAQARRHLLDLLARDARVLAAIEAEHGGMNLFDQVQRVLRLQG